jgi:tRNA U34 5-carboxymethylaminomethyl modifying GTPase MnmE/TrmE
MLRETLDQIGLLTGKITSDDILNDIFSRFCIGK